MKRNLFLFFFLCITSLQLYAQELLWENAYGGNKKDWIHHTFQNWQGNYVFSGHSGSGISGDKTEESRGLTDSWIIETDPNGNILWQKTLGGNGFDKIVITLELKDGGYLLAGESNSGISGEKNQPAWNSRDLWLVKLDEKREIVWQQTYGGTIFENLSDIISTRDGGYILVAESNSPVSGDRTANSYGGADLWVLKLDNFGEIEWQRSYGGDNHDIGGKILESTKGYIIVGSSSSGISGNKTLESIGQSDYWLFEINSTGDILWQKVIGGNSADFIADFIPATGGGYILAGESSSGVSGNKDIPRKGFEDLWLVKTDDRGNIIWQNSYAGPGSQWMAAVAPSSDSGYLISAMSYSEIGHDKTEPNRGDRDFWMLKITDDGEICWDKTLGGKNTDQPMESFEDTDGNFVVAGWSDSGATGDKSEESLGYRDAWVIKISQPEITEPLVKIQDPITACDENGDGFTEFDLKYLEKQIIGGQEN
ncbi:MAG TPA: T9SS C-terminal target domain-containing protein, partial [Salinimicrobium sp.]|nr:T9SS C-terminal target domain-containing protein [Salinimicrobium sp.]